VRPSGGVRRHLAGCAAELVSKLRGTDEKAAAGLFPDRTPHCCGYYSNHLGYRHPQLPALANASQRSLGRRLSAHDQHLGGYVFLDVSGRGIPRQYVGYGRGESLLGGIDERVHS